MIIQVSSTGLYLDFIRFTFSIHFRLTICKVKNFLLKFFVLKNMFKPVMKLSGLLFGEFVRICL